MGLTSCDPFCATLEFINLSPTHSVDMANATFILEGFQVDCVGLLDSIGPEERATCTIEQFVTPGFQVLNWYRFPPRSGGWGF